jgi:hypothetical protein
VCIGARVERNLTVLFVATFTLGASIARVIVKMGDPRWIIRMALKSLKHFSGLFCKIISSPGY